jgi:prevent-host-death family protein
MGKMVGMAEFKANCTRLLREVSQGGEAITVTSRGKPLVVVKSADEQPRKIEPAFGMLKSDRYRFNIEPEDSVLDADWEQQWEAKWTERGFPGPDDKR